jgi:sigma-B regulation protein RsbU (phosphoserine phosphatase)
MSQPVLQKVRLARGGENVSGFGGTAEESTQDNLTTSQESLQIEHSELAALLHVTQMVNSSLDLDQVLNQVMDHIIQLTQAERGFLMLFNQDGELEFKIARNMDQEAIETSAFGISRSIVRQVAERGQPVVTTNAQEDPRFRTRESVLNLRLRSILCVPLRVKGKVTGVIYADNRIKAGIFGDRQRDLLTAFANQAAISIENARLHAQEIQQRLINQELETARTIQKSFLPQAVPQHPNWDIASLWRPMREVAGDFYDFYTLPDGRLAVVIADVSGKGVPAALFMALSVTVLRFAMGLNFAPGELMAQANRAILSNQQSRMFTTAFIGYLNFESAGMQFALAGHNPPLLYRAATGRCEYLEASGVAMGVFEDANYDSAIVSLSDGDVLVLYTDGITEAINGDEEEFEEQRLEELVTQHAFRPAQELANLIVEAVADFTQDQGAFDDETLVIIKRG